MTTIRFLLLFALTGCIPTMFLATTKTSLDTAARGGNVSTAMTDLRISASIKKDLIKNGFRELYTKINVEVVEGRVLYTGSVQSEEDIIKAVEIAWDQKDVVEVINELQIDKDSNIFNGVQVAKDAWITSQIKAKSILNRSVKFINYTVVTSKNIVYLFGIGRSREEIEIMAHIASETAGVEKVISYVKLQDDL